MVNRFDRPRLLHQTHVKMIIDSPSVREGTGKELRKLHDVTQQHVRALRALGQEPSPAFITSVIELKLDTTTMFEWQRHTQGQTEVPHYREILEFIDQASEISNPLKPHNCTETPTSKGSKPYRSVTSHAANHESSHSSVCPLCKPEKHPLYSCPKFRSFSFDQRMATVMSNNTCMNCLGKGHYISQCKSIHKCRKCQRPHHTLLHDDQKEQSRNQQSSGSTPSPSEEEATVSTNTASTTRVKSNSLLMTCQVMVECPNGSFTKIRALLDSGSSASFVSERVAQSLRLQRTKQGVSVSGIGGTPLGMKIDTVATFKLHPVSGKKEAIDVTALVVPRVTRDLPTIGVPFDGRWRHLHGLRLADPDFSIPARIDVLLGIEVFTEVLLNGRRRGLPGTPVAMETVFGWVLPGSEVSDTSALTMTAHHSSVELSDDIIQKFWRIEEPPSHPLAQYSQEERIALHQFKTTHTHP